MPDSETREVPISLPLAVYEQLGGDDRAVAATLANLAEDHADLRTAIETYTERGDDRPPQMESQPGVAPPIAAFVGFDLGDVSDGEAVVEFQPGARHANPMGTLHGGVLCDIGDAAMGYAYASTLDPGESFTTLELDVKFRRPVWDRPLTATGRVLDAGRTVGLVACDVRGPEGELVARLGGVNMTLRGDEASGR